MAAGRALYAAAAREVVGIARARPAMSMGSWGSQRERTPLGPLRPPAVHRFNQHKRSKKKASLGGSPEQRKAGNGKAKSSGYGQSPGGQQSRTARRPPGFDRSPPRYMPGGRRAVKGATQSKAPEQIGSNVVLARTVSSLERKVL